MGYQTKPRTREIVCDWDGLEPAEGCEPLRATVRTNLTWDELDRLPNPVVVRDGQTYLRNDDEIRSGIAPYILTWNVEGRDSTTGEVGPLPAPADGGPDVLRACDRLVTSWLAVTMKTIHLPAADQKKDGGAPSGDTPPPSPAASSGSRARRKTPR